MPLHFDTRSQPMADRLDYWTHTLATQAMPVKLDVRNNALVTAGLISASIGATQTISGFGGNHLYERTAATIKSADPDGIGLVIPSAGSPIVEQDGRQIAVPNGSMMLLDSSRPYRVVMQEPFRWQILAFPKSALRLTTAQLKNITAISLPNRSGIGRVVQGAIQHVISQSSILESDAEAEAIGQHAIALVATLIRSVFVPDLEVQGKTRVLHERVTSFIRRHHSDPQLSPTCISRAHHVSLRSLHSAFAHTGNSLMETVRIIRLEYARKDLDHPPYSRGNAAQIGQIAHAHGFTSASDFARAFRTSYGMAPTKYREINSETA